MLAALPASERAKFVRMLMALVQQAEKDSTEGPQTPKRGGRPR
jgi:hypothetical protein